MAQCMNTNIKCSRQDFLKKLLQPVLWLQPHYEVLRTHSENPGTAPSPISIGRESAREKKFVPVMITPFQHNGKIDLDNLSRLIDFYLAAGVKGFFANCASSEMYQLSED